MTFDGGIGGQGNQGTVSSNSLANLSAAAANLLDRFGKDAFIQGFVQGASDGWELNVFFGVFIACPIFIHFATGGGK